VQNEGERIKFKALHLAERLPPWYVILYYFVILYFLSERRTSGENRALFHKFCEFTIPLQALLMHFRIPSPLKMDSGK
jgi:hypothetical protein